ncbi:MAG: ABC transporter substrate-binding protein [Pseudorhodoplanes sp.]
MRNENHSFVPRLVEQYEKQEISRREFLRTATLLGMSAASAYSIVGGSDPALAQTDIPTGGTAKLAYPVYDVTRPQSGATVELSNLTFPVVQTLTRIGTDNICRPLVCESWKVSDDLKSWTFQLRKNAKWRKGRPFIADDVVANFKRLLDPANGSGSLSVMRSYLLKEAEKDGKKTTELWDANAIEKVDDHTVRFNLRIPQVALPEHFTQYTSVMVDPEEGGILKPGANGTGPFELVEMEVQRRAVYKKSSNYWGRPAYLDQVEFIHAGDDENAMLTMLASKQVDGVKGLPIELLNRAKDMPHVNVYSSVTAFTATLALDTTVKPWDDVRVRHALRLAVDTQKQVALALRGAGKAGEHHHVCPVHPDYAPLPPMPQDVAKAKALLAEAGYANGFNFECLVPANPSWEVASLEGMAEDFRALGVTMKINVVPRPRYLDVWDKMPAIYTDWAHRPLGIQMLGLAYRSSAPWNISKWKNKEFDEMMDKADATVDPVERRKYVGRCEELLRTEGPMLQPLWVNVQTAYDKRVKGFQIHPTRVVHIEDIGISS